MTNSDIGQNLENIRNLLDIDAPEGNNADDMFEDVLKHNLWGIHIKLENDAYEILLNYTTLTLKLLCCSSISVIDCV